MNELRKRIRECDAIAFMALALSLALLAFGCGKSNYVPHCPEGESLIESKIPDPRTADLVFQIANLELIRHHAYSRDAALEVIDTLDELLEFGPTYGAVVRVVSSKVAGFNNQYGVEVLLISGYLDILNEEIPVSPCDVELLRVHLARQRALIESLE